MASRKPNKHSKAQTAAQASPGQPAPVAVEQQQGSAAGASADALAIDAPPEQKRDAEAAAKMTAAASGTAGAAGTRNAPELAGCEFVTLQFPLPAGIPPRMLEIASVIVRAKSDRGRRRAGRQFTREESAIQFAYLTEQQIDALTGDAELIVSLRVPQPN